MPIKLVWEDEAQTIQRWDFSAPWDTDDLIRTMEENIADMEGNPTPRLDVIINMPHDAGLPNGLLARMGSTYRYISTEFPDDDGLVVFVVQGALNQAFVNMFLRLYRDPKWVAAYTLDDAREMIAKDRVKVPKP